MGPNDLKAPFLEPANQMGGKIRISTSELCASANMSSYSLRPCLSTLTIYVVKDYLIKKVLSSWQNLRYHYTDMYYSSE